MTEGFYNDLAADYHLIFGDWSRSVDRQGEILASLLADAGVAPPARVLDCACGIGTQVIGLARAGYRMTGTDLSRDAIDRARSEVAAAGLEAELAVSDMRSIDTAAGSGFAAAICCDNSLPHLLTDDDLDAALAAIRRCLEPGAPFIASIRDYDDLAIRCPTGTEPQLLRDADGRRRIVGQAWEWTGDIIDIALFILVEQDAGWSCTLRPAQYRALQRSQLDDALARAGFAEVKWSFPDTTGYYQPIVIARAE